LDSVIKILKILLSDFGNRDVVDVYLAFILVSSMIYNPIIEVCSNLAILTFLDVRIRRMKEIEAMPILDGTKDVKIRNYG